MSVRGKGSILFIAVILVVNVILSLWPVRIDATSEGRFTLSSETLRVLSSLDRPVTVDLYRSRSVAGVPPSLQSHGDYVEDLLREYSRRSGGKLLFRRHDPAVGTEAEERALKSGMLFEELRPGDASSRFCLGVCLSKLGRQDVSLRQLNPRALNSLEYDLTCALSQLLSKDRPTVGILSSLPVFGGADLETRQQRPEWEIVSSLRENNYEVLDLGGDLSRLPSTVDILLMVHPPELDLESLKVVDGFVQRGGRLLAFLDPGCWTAMMYRRDGHVSMSSLPGLLSAWGLSFDHEHTVLDKDLATIVLNRRSVPENHLEWLSLKGEQMSQTDDVTSKLSLVEMFHAGSFGCQPKDGIRVTGILRSSRDAQLVSSQLAFRPQSLLEREYVSGGSSLWLGVCVEGRLPSAFGSGSVEGGRAIVIGDADCLHDSFTKGRKTDNLQLLLNCMDRLRQSGEGLLELRNRSYASRRLEVLHDRLAEDQRHFQRELEEFQSERLSLQREISSLEDRRKDGILTDAEGEELRVKYQGILDADRRLRGIQASAGRSREGYRQRIVLLNMLFGPVLVLLVLLFRPYYGLFRRNWRHGLYLSLVLVVSLGVLVGVSAWCRHRSSGSQRVSRSCLLPERISRDRLRGVVFRHGEERFHLDRDSSGGWTVREKYGYPANLQHLNELTSGVNVCDGLPVEVREEDLSVIGLDEGSGWHLSFVDAGGHASEITFGGLKLNYDHEAQGRYIRRGDGPVLLAGQVFRLVGQPVSGWLEGRLPGFGKDAKRISRESEFRDFRWSLERRPGGYEVQGRIPRGMRVRSSVVKNIIDNFRYVRVLDVSREVKGFVPQCTLEVIGGDDILYRYVFGHDRAGVWYGRLESASSVREGAAASRLQGMYGGFYLQVNEKLVRGFLRKRLDLYMGRG